jgi:hypothetical protein
VRPPSRLLGSKLVEKLTDHGRQAVPASLNAAWPSISLPPWQRTADEQRLRVGRSGVK